MACFNTFVFKSLGVCELVVFTCCACVLFSNVLWWCCGELRVGNIFLKRNRFQCDIIFHFDAYHFFFLTSLFVAFRSGAAEAGDA